MIWPFSPCFSSRLCPALACAALLSATACTQVPELDAAVPGHLRDAPYPDLVSPDRLLGMSQSPLDQAGQIEQSLAARRDRLQARARELNAPVVGPDARKRMQSGVNR